VSGSSSCHDRSASLSWVLPVVQDTTQYTHADTLRGSKRAGAGVVGRPVLRPARPSELCGLEYRRWNAIAYRVLNRP